MQTLAPILFLGIFVFIFGAGLLYLVSLVGPKISATFNKMMPYECGVEGQDTEKTQVSIRFYLTAILFIIFDIEIIFIFPWALIYNAFIKESGAFILVEMIIFIAILAYGLFYIWKARALEWE